MKYAKEDVAVLKRIDELYGEDPEFLVIGANRTGDINFLEDTFKQKKALSIVGARVKLHQEIRGWAPKSAPP